MKLHNLTVFMVHRSLSECSHTKASIQWTLVQNLSEIWVFYK